MAGHLVQVSFLAVLEVIASARCACVLQEDMFVQFFPRVEPSISGALEAVVDLPTLHYPRLSQANGQDPAGFVCSLARRDKQKTYRDRGDRQLVHLADLCVYIPRLPGQGQLHTQRATVTHGRLVSIWVLLLECSAHGTQDKLGLAVRTRDRQPIEITRQAQCSSFNKSTVILAQLRVRLESLPASGLHLQPSCGASILGGVSAVDSLQSATAPAVTKLGGWRVGMGEQRGNYAREYGKVGRLEACGRGGGQSVLSPAAALVHVTRPSE